MEERDRARPADEDAWDGPDVAVVGMAGRFPGARDPEELWRRLAAGEELIADLDAAATVAAGVAPEVLEHPDYVGRKGVLDGVADFDAGFFGVNPRDARLMDPQQRLFLEHAHQVLESAGYDPRSYDGLVGVFAGTNLSSYQLHNLMSNPAAVAGTSVLQVQIGNDKDYLATSVAFKLDLKGPSVTVQTACSTSLVAVHLACQSLIEESCDLALAGGVSVVLPEPLGYTFQRDGILSPDGSCRPFDERAAGTVFSDGVGVVALKRLADARRDGDTVLAVIRATAINNDGADKVGFTAPSVGGQAEVVIEALGAAGVEPEEVSYVECHGTGTKLGDPIELAALDRAFRGRSEPCWVGSVKGNLGHLRMASGVTGLIKVVQMLRHRCLAPTLHFEAPNPELRLEERPFRVVAETMDWSAEGPRLAGVSSFGMGGTNAHVVVEEAPEPPPTDGDRPWQLLILSARTPSALERLTAELAEHLGTHPELDPADVAHTLQVGRRPLPLRRALLCPTAGGAATARSVLEDADAYLDRHADAEDRPVVFLFPGQGTQRPGAGADLYRREPVFRRAVDECCDTLTTHLGLDLRTLLYPEPDRLEEAAERLRETSLTQPAVFVTSWALAELWRSWGVKPAAMIGHSLGEYVAATVAGVFPLEKALELVAERGRLLQSLPGGAMLAVPLPVEEVEERLPGDLSIAAVNGERATVVSGPEDAVAAFEAALDGLDARRLRTSHAFHSPMVEPILEPFRERLATLDLQAPEVPFVSNLTGTWITAEEARDPGYWVRHLRRPVCFADGVRTLLEEPARVFLEVGTGRTLTGLTRRLAGRDAAVVASLGTGGAASQKEAAEVRQLTEALGRLWLAGVDVNFQAVRGAVRRRRVPLPTYPFERRRHWVEPGRAMGSAGWVEAKTLDAIEESADDTETPPSHTRRDAPRDALERAVAEVWCRALGLDEVGVFDDFFELGGHSLLATELAAQLRAELGVEVTVQGLYEAPTVARLATALRGREADAAPPTTAAERPADGSLPFSAAQERMAFLDRLEPGSTVYNLFVPLRLRGELEAEALTAAFEDLVARHESLRTVFEHRDDELRAMTGGGPARLEVEELGGATLDERVAEEVRRPFDLAAGPLLRATLLVLGDAEHALLVTVHHAVADQLSLGLILRDLFVLYGHRRGAAKLPELPELELQYADFAAWERRHLSGEALEEQLGYWRRRLAELPACLELATDRPRPRTQSLRGGHLGFALDAELSTSLEALARREKVSLFMVLLAGFQLLLHRWSASDDIAVGAPFARRETAESRNVVGPFFNPVVLRGELSGDPTFHELLDRVRETVTGAHAHQDVPMDRLVEALAPERDPAYNPLFQVMFSYLEGGGEEAAAGAGVEVEPIQAESGHTHFDLFLVVEPRRGRLEGNLGYCTDLFDGATAGLLVEHFETLLAAAVERPGARLSELCSAVPPQKLEVVVSASFTAEAIADPLKLVLGRLGLPAKVELASYAQLFQQLLDPESLTARNREGMSLLLLRLEDWGGEEDPRRSRRRIEDEVERFLDALAALERRTGVRGLVVTTPPSEKALADDAMARFLRCQERLLGERLAASPGFDWLDGAEVAGRWNVARPLDPHTDALGHIPYTEAWFAGLAGEVARRLSY